jgi:TonB-dependent starch-binding outer membrane protein SusC
MENKLLLLIGISIKYFFIGLALQIFFIPFLFAFEPGAKQIKSVNDVRINLNVRDGSIVDIFKIIESKTSFNFVYDSQIIDPKITFAFSRGSITVKDVLLEISRKALLGFKQINENINVSAIERLDQKFENEIEVIIQTRNISGKVISQEDNQGLPGVNVIEMGTSNGTVTDVNGNYSLNVMEGATLVFSSVGYTREEVVVGNRSIIDLAMKPDIQQLDELVVVGYGTVKKSDLTGSVARVDRETFATQPMTQITEMLTGTVAGFRSNQGSSASGGGSLEIRGPTSLSAGTDPLIVLDGAIYNGSIRDINPSDVQSIDILKDASSAAIFGAKAASGVVLITTTKGAVGKPTFSFSTQIGMAEVSNPLREFGPGEFEKFRGEYLRALNVDLPTHYYFNPNNLPAGISVQEWSNYVPNPNPNPTLEWLGRLQLSDNEIANYMSGNTISWYDEITQRGLRQKYDLSVKGGSENISYYWSVGYTDNKGVRFGDKYSVTRSRLNVSADIADFLTVGTNTQFAYRDESNVDAALNYNNTPYGDKYEDDGITLRWYTNGQQNATNPLLNAYYQQRDRGSYTLLSNLFADVKLPLGINYKLVYQPRIGYSRDYNYWPTTTIEGGRTHNNGYGSRIDNLHYEWMIDNIVSWNKEIGIHNIDLTFLFNAEKFQSWRSTQTGENFAPNELLHFHSIQSASVISASNNDEYSTADALMGRINYTLLDKYLLTASIRRDGYSAFGRDNKRALFPAVALAWQISREDFWDESWTFNRLKMRLSWGVNGNRDIGRYSALARLGQNLYYDGTGTQIGLYNNSLANAGLAWEETSAYNIGFDIGLFGDRVDISADLYQSTTKNLLMLRRLPQIIGYNDVMSNLGELSNRGFELTVNSVNASRPNFNWKSNFVFSLNRNKIERLFGDIGEYKVEGQTKFGELPDFTNKWFPGQSVNVVWDYELIGVWQLDQADEAAKYKQLPGDFIATDVNNDGIYTEPDDKKFIGQRDPQYLLGLRNEFGFLKNFTASLFIRADLGHIGAIGFHKHPGAYERTNYRRINYWTPENPTNRYSSLNPFTQLYSGGYNVYFSRSFVRIQDLSLAYNIPQEVVKRMGLDRLRIYGNVRNLFTFTEWEDFDPESGNTPMPRIFTLGLDLTF